MTAVGCDCSCGDFHQPPRMRYVVVHPISSSGWVDTEGIHTHGEDNKMRAEAEWVMEGVNVPKVTFNYGWNNIIIESYRTIVLVFKREDMKTCLIVVFKGLV